MNFPSSCSFVFNNFEKIRVRVRSIRVRVLSSLAGSPKTISGEDKEKFHAFYEELNSYKVRLENILCETDKKEQDHLH